MSKIFKICTCTCICVSCSFKSSYLESNCLSKAKNSEKYDKRFCNSHDLEKVMYLYYHSNMFDTNFENFRIYSTAIVMRRFVLNVNAIFLSQMTNCGCTHLKHLRCTLEFIKQYFGFELLLKSYFIRIYTYVCR